MNHARFSPYLWCGLALIAALVLSVGLGSERIAPVEIGQVLFAGLLREDAPAGLKNVQTIVLRIRLPWTLLMAITGAALGGSGAAYQGLLRNPLADPYLIGVAPGAALGAAAVMVFLGPATPAGLLGVPAAAFLGAMLTVALVYRIARVGKTAPVTTLILAGVAVGALASALTAFIMLLGENEMKRVLYFLWGGFGLGGWEPVLAVLPYAAVGLAAITLLGQRINVLQFGDEQALQMGISVERVKLALVFAASLVAAAAVAFAGIIGFVGLVVPHVIRLLWGPDYRRLVPLSAMAGAVLLLGADSLRRSIPWLNAPPLGIVTAVLGAPFFLYLLRREQRAYW